MNSLRREYKFNHYYSDLVEGRRLASEIKTSLDLQDAAEQNKVRRQFEEWNQNVYGKLQNRISERLDQTTSHDINVKRRQEFQVRVRDVAVVPRPPQPHARRCVTLPREFPSPP